MNKLIAYTFLLTLFSCNNSKNDASVSMSDANIEKKDYNNFYRINDYKDSNKTKFIFELISKAKSIDSDSNLIIKKNHNDLPQKESIYFTRNDTLRKISVLRRDWEPESNGVLVPKMVPYREFFFIDEVYTILLHPKFGAEIPENKWEWNRIIMYNDSIQAYIGQSYKGQKGIFIKDTTDHFRKMEEQTIDLLKELKEEY